MALRVSGKNLDIGPALRMRAEDEVLQAVSKYYDGSYNGHLTVEKEGTGFQTECTLHLSTGRSVSVSGSAHDAYASLAVVVERVAKQLRRYKREKQGKQQAAAGVAATSAQVANGVDMSAPILTRSSDAGLGAARAIVAERLDNLPRHSVPAAADYMEGRELQSLVFRNEGTGRVNILRLREDGSIGWIDVPAGPQTV
jgi:ribosomal subunit interface protein